MFEQSRTIARTVIQMTVWVSILDGIWVIFDFLLLEVDAHAVDIINGLAPLLVFSLDEVGAINLIQFLDYFGLFLVLRGARGAQSGTQRHPW